MELTSLKGRLLVATPDMLDPNFFRAVVLLLEHGGHGSLGVVLNRPTGASVATPWPEWAELVAPPARLFRGGPVEPGTVIGLARRAGDAQPESWSPVMQDIGVIDLRADPRESRDRLLQLRIFSGYAGWAAAQLEAEFSVGGWLVTDAEPEDPFTPAPDALWHRALNRPPHGPSWIAGHRPLRPSN